jgi:hypothetical protein
LQTWSTGARASRICASAPCRSVRDRWRRQRGRGAGAGSHGQGRCPARGAIRCSRRHRGQCAPGAARRLRVRLRPRCCIRRRRRRRRHRGCAGGRHGGGGNRPVPGTDATVPCSGCGSGCRGELPSPEPMVGARGPCAAALPTSPLGERRRRHVPAQSPHIGPELANHEVVRLVRLRDAIDSRVAPSSETRTSTSHVGWVTATGRSLEPMQPFAWGSASSMSNARYLPEASVRRGDRVAAGGAIRVRTRQVWLGERQDLAGPCVTGPTTNRRPVRRV